MSGSIHSSQRRVTRTRAGWVAPAAVPLLLVGLIAAGCASEAERQASDAAADSGDASASPSVYSGGDASTEATEEPTAATEEPSETSSDEPSDEPTSTWSPEPEDQAGPTAAPELPVVEVAANEQAELDTGVEVELDELRATTVEAQTPGEFSGPAVVVGVTVTNGTTEAVDLSSAVVTLESDDITGTGTTAGSPEPFSGTLAAGDSAHATYVFMLDPAEDREVVVSVNYAAGEPVAVFTGRTS